MSAGPVQDLNIVKVLETPNEGRYVVAARDIEPGELIHCSEPYVVSLSPEFIKQRCYACHSIIHGELPDAFRHGSQHISSAKKPVGKSGGKKKIKCQNYLNLKEQLNKKLAKEKASQKKGSAPTPAKDETSEDDDGHEDTAPVVCSGCNVVAFCNSHCHKSYSKHHIDTHECLALRLVAESSAHRKPEEVHFMNIILTMIFRAISEGFLDRLMDEQVAKHPILAQEGNADDDGRFTTCSTIPADAVKLRRLRDAGLLIELLDDTTTRSDSSHTVEAFEALMQQCANPDSNVPCTWRDMSNLVTNLSLVTKDRLSEYHTLHRFFLKVISKCPGHIFGLKREIPAPSAVPSDASVLPYFDKPSVSTGNDDDFLVPAGHEVVSVNTFHRICAALQCNGFGVFNESDRCIAIGAYPRASYFNHSCQPNICRVMVGRKALFYSLTAVPAGSPLCISYTDAEKETSDRRDVLLKTYRFYCECSRCRCGGGINDKRCDLCSARGYLRPLRGPSGLTGEMECTMCRKHLVKNSVS